MQPAATSRNTPQAGNSARQVPNGQAMGGTAKIDGGPPNMVGGPGGPVPAPRPQPQVSPRATSSMPIPQPQQSNRYLAS